MTVDDKLINPSTEPCIFCRIIKGEIPSHKLYEDDYSLAILDINPVNQGHVLVMPKKHYKTITDTPLRLLQHLIEVSYDIVMAVQKTLDPDGFNIIQNNNMQAGQLVPHLHIHLIPRFGGDEKTFGFLWGTKKIEEKEMKEIKEKIIKTMKK